MVRGTHVGGVRGALRQGDEARLLEGVAIHARAWALAFRRVERPDLSRPRGHKALVSAANRARREDGHVGAAQATLPRGAGRCLQGALGERERACRRTAGKNIIAGNEKCSIGGREAVARVLYLVCTLRNSMGGASLLFFVFEPAQFGRKRAGGKEDSTPALSNHSEMPARYLTQSPGASPSRT